MNIDQCIMKKTKLYLLGLVLIAASCGKDANNPIDALTTVEVETEKKETAEIPTLPTSLPIPAGGIEISLPAYRSATESKKFFEDNHTNPNLVNTVKAKKIYLKMVAPDTGNFNCMDRVKVYISANGYDEILVAQKDNIPKGLKTIETDPVDVELKNYFVQDSVFFRVVPHIVDYPPANGLLEMGSTFKVSITASKY